MSRRHHVLLVPSLVLALLLATACSSSDDPAAPAPEVGDDPTASAPAEADTSGVPTVVVTVRGTEPEPLADGFVLLEAGCDDRSTPQEPSFGAFDVQVPQAWEGRSASKDPAGGATTFVFDDSERELTLDLVEGQPEQPAAELLERFSLGEELVEAFEVTWGGARHQVYAAGDQWLAALPAIDADAVMAVPVWTVVQFGYGSVGEVPLDEAVVQQVFESVVLLDCAVEPYVSAYRDADVVYEG